MAVPGGDFVCRARHWRKTVDKASRRNVFSPARRTTTICHADLGRTVHLLREAHGVLIDRQALDLRAVAFDGDDMEVGIQNHAEKSIPSQHE